MRGTAIKLKSAAFQSHLWIVVSDVHPTKRVVLAFNLTDKANYPGCCCILNPGEHEYIQKASAVRYFSPKLWKPEQIAAKIKVGTFVQYTRAPRRRFWKRQSPGLTTQRIWTRITWSSCLRRRPRG